MESILISWVGKENRIFLIKCSLMEINSKLKLFKMDSSKKKFKMENCKIWILNCKMKRKWINFKIKIIFKMRNIKMMGFNISNLNKNKIISRTNKFSNFKISFKMIKRKYQLYHFFKCLIYTLESKFQRKLLIKSDFH